ncbi:NAD(P)-binding protein [Coniophora puteana RWD-64-598 SS2]|uniref:NAD(P)-binding protein n=1 Tax=Coniophora puteana (strain RWD-64-598) TaxID=741705 RepID=A0A5M3M9U5_CONPW|nr:NAD(P)-binding protein [Coniophora puteana RWD-64-598 SS2]EIW75867.1 NAD(P)-binding protein [Coniophora puteana RWD-64-598 SS2]
MASSRVWFITGASSGFGRSMTEYILKNDGVVIATLRKPEVLADFIQQYPSDRLLVLKLDVTQKDDVVNAFSRAREAFGRIDVVFNNAAVLAIGEVESMDDETARKLFEVNFWGAASVTKEALKFFREVNNPMGGRLLQVSSGAGLRGPASNGYYTASKFAFEGFTESVIREVDPAWNIKVTIVEPGPFRTNITTDNVTVVPPHPAYDNPTLPGIACRNALADPADGDTEKAVAVINRLSLLEDPPMRLPLHRKVVGRMREKAQHFAETVEQYGSWTDDLYHID